MADIRTNARTFLSARFRRMSDEQCQRIHAQHEPEPLPEDFCTEDQGHRPPLGGAIGRMMRR
jgi:hypothetical protein